MKSLTELGPKPVLVCRVIIAQTAAFFYLAIGLFLLLPLSYIPQNHPKVVTCLKNELVFEIVPVWGYEIISPLQPEQ
jgi:hypothetical protein